MADLEKALFGGGCFWCIEAVYNRVEGVHSAVSGYAGGTPPNPSYEAVCSGMTGHAEVVQITFDPDVVSYEDLLDIFWVVHDPTTLNRQGADTGTQYRSVIFTYGEAQHDAAEAAIEQAQKAFADPIVTELSPAPEFYSAEAYHQEYYAHNPMQGYCRVVIAPKLQKFMTKFAERLKR